MLLDNIEVDMSQISDLNISVDMLIDIFKGCEGEPAGAAGMWQAGLPTLEQQTYAFV